MCGAPFSEPILWVDAQSPSRLAGQALACRYCSEAPLIPARTLAIESFVYLTMVARTQPWIRRAGACTR